jgi:hypothetical protein
MKDWSSSITPGRMHHTGRAPVGFWLGFFAFFPPLDLIQSELGLGWESVSRESEIDVDEFPSNILSLSFSTP